MAIIFDTTEPRMLLDDLNRGIVSGRISTWRIDSEGDYTSAHPKWANKAWFVPNVDEANHQLKFGIISSKKYPLTNELYAVYHGRFAACLLANFDNIITGLSITPLLDPEIDIIPIPYK